MNSETKQNSAQTPLLEIRDLKTWFPVRRGIFSGGTKQIRAVDGVSLYLNRNETLGLVGESGCGKTTLGRTILRLEAATSGDILFEGESLLTLNRGRMNRLRRRIQVVFQDPLSSLNPRLNIMDIVTEGLVRFNMVEGSRHAHAARLMREVGLSEDVIYRFPHEFSGGQRQRINVARAISLKPDLIICDEAVSALDVSIQAQVLNLLQTLQEEHHLSYLFISHDLSVVSNIADRVAVMYMGRIVETGYTADVIRNPLHPYTKTLIAAVPVAGRKRIDEAAVRGETPSASDTPGGCRFNPRCGQVRKICRQTPPPVIRKGERLVMCHLYEGESAEPSGKKPSS